MNEGLERKSPTVLHKEVLEHLAEKFDETTDPVEQEKIAQYAMWERTRVAKKALVAAQEVQAKLHALREKMGIADHMPGSEERTHYSKYQPSGKESVDIPTQPSANAPRLTAENYVSNEAERMAEQPQAEQHAAPLEANNQRLPNPEEERKAA